MMQAPRSCKYYSIFIPLTIALMNNKIIVKAITKMLNLYIYYSYCTHTNLIVIRRIMV